MSEFNQTNILAFAMRRSGHHGVLNWLFSHFHGPVVHLNNCVFTSSMQFDYRTYRTPENQSRSESSIRLSGNFGAHSTSYYNNGKFLGRHEHADQQQQNISMEEKIDAFTSGEKRVRIALNIPDRRDVLCLSFEDYDIQHASLVPKSLIGRGWSGRSCDLLVVRDPFNWLASRYKGGHRINEVEVSRYVNQLNEFRGETNHLPGVIGISYNRWFVDKEYRKSLIERFKIDFTDAGKMDVPPNGDGSSFDKKNFDGRADQMDVLNRWAQFRDDPVYRGYFEKFPELSTMSKEVFDFAPF